ncbi:MAG: ATP-dependent RNA helicase HrpA, partial [Planctomycetaceae bacterium]
MGPGICIRLYSQADYNTREAFTAPEIQRTNLAAVILRTLSLKLGNLEDFPFLDPPKVSVIREGYRTLEELGAIVTEAEAAAARSDSAAEQPEPAADTDQPAASLKAASQNSASPRTPAAAPGSAKRSPQAGDLTDIGRRMSTLPVDPAIARMILAAVEVHALPEVLAIAAFLECQDPRERPLEKQQAADEAHRKFFNRDSDFLTILNLWDAWHEKQRTLSNSQLRKWCQQHFLSWLRMREWVDVHTQLRELLEDSDDPAIQQAAKALAKQRQHPEKSLAEQRHNDFAATHKALLTGLLPNIAMQTPE